MTRTPEIKRRQREFRGGQIITKFKIAESTEWGRTVICNLGMGRERERERERDQQPPRRGHSLCTLCARDKWIMQRMKRGEKREAVCSSMYYVLLRTDAAAEAEAVCVSSAVLRVVIEEHIGWMPREFQSVYWQSSVYMYVCVCTMRRRGRTKKGENEMESTSFPISSFSRQQRGGGQ